MDRQALVVLATTLLAGCPGGNSPLQTFPDGASPTSWQEYYSDSAPVADAGSLLDALGSDAQSSIPSCTASLCGLAHPVPGSNPSCYCDSTCTTNNDCCPGYDTVCGAKSGCSAAEICGDNIDNDCDGEVDEGCSNTNTDAGAGNTNNNNTGTTVTVPVSGDCVWVGCPPNAPYPVGCNITMSGSDCRGCVVSSPTSSAVYFREGEGCNNGAAVQGELLCSSVPGSGLNLGNCSYDKLHRYYVKKIEDCPTKPGDGC